CVSSRNARFLYGIGGRWTKGQGELAEPHGRKRPRAASGVTPDPVFASRAPCLNSRRGVGSVRGARRFDSPAAAFVVVNGVFEIRVLLARKEAELVENGEMLLGLGQVTQYEIRLADVLVGATMLGVDGQRLLVDRDGLGGVPVLARAVGKPVV